MIPIVPTNKSCACARLTVAIPLRAINHNHFRGAAASPVTLSHKADVPVVPPAPMIVISEFSHHLLMVKDNIIMKPVVKVVQFF